MLSCRCAIARRNSREGAFVSSPSLSPPLFYEVSVAIYQSALLNFGAANMADYGVTRLLHPTAATSVARSRS